MVEYRTRDRQSIAKGCVLKGTNRLSVTVSFEPELFNAIRDQGLAEDRSFSSMIAILVKRALRAKNVPL